MLVSKIRTIASLRKPVRFVGFQGYFTGLVTDLSLAKRSLLFFGAFSVLEKINDAVIQETLFTVTQPHWRNTCVHRFIKVQYGLFCSHLLSKHFFPVESEIKHWRINVNNMEALKRSRLGYKRSFFVLVNFLLQMRQYIRCYRYFTLFFNSNSTCVKLWWRRGVEFPIIILIYELFSAQLWLKWCFLGQEHQFCCCFSNCQRSKKVWRPPHGRLEREFYLFNLSHLIRPARFSFSQMKVGKPTSHFLGLERMCS